MANPLVCRSLAGCGKRFKKDVARWCCSTCDFDLCDTCSLDVVTEEADFAAAAADEAIRMIDEAEAEAAAEAEAEAEAEVAAADRPEAEARACSGCGLALLVRRRLRTQVCGRPEPLELRESRLSDRDLRALL